MTIRAPRTCVIVAAALAAATAAGAQTGRSVIRGRVTDTSGVALQGVNLFDAADPRTMATTNAEGAFTLTVTSGPTRSATAWPIRLAATSG